MIRNVLLSLLAATLASGCSGGGDFGGVGGTSAKKDERKRAAAGGGDGDIELDDENEKASMPGQVSGAFLNVITICGPAPGELQGVAPGEEAIGCAAVDQETLAKAPGDVRFSSLRFTENGGPTHTPTRYEQAAPQSRYHTLTTLPTGVIQRVSGIVATIQLDDRTVRVKPLAIDDAADLQQKKKEGYLDAAAVLFGWFESYKKKKSEDDGGAEAPDAGDPGVLPDEKEPTKLAVARVKANKPGAGASPCADGPDDGSVARVIDDVPNTVWNSCHSASAGDRLEVWLELEAPASVRSVRITPDFGKMVGGAAVNTGNMIYDVELARSFANFDQGNLSGPKDRQTFPVEINRLETVTLDFGAGVDDVRAIKISVPTNDGSYVAFFDIAVWD